MNKTSSPHFSTGSPFPPSCWSPFPLGPEAQQRLEQIGAELFVPTASTPAASKPAVNLVILLPPDQVLERWRSLERPPNQALEQLLAQYSKALDLSRQGVNLRMESELLGTMTAPASPLSAATLLQILTVQPALRTVLEQLDQSTPSDDLSLQRLHSGCQSAQALLDDWWDPHQGEAQIYQQLLLQQDAQQQRLLAQLARDINP